MLEIVLFAIIALLLLISLTLFLRLQKFQSQSNASQRTALHEEEIFHTIPLPTIYKKNGNWHTNKTFSHAFGAMSKETTELLSMLPKCGEHSCELQFDNGIIKQTLIYTAPLLWEHQEIFVVVLWTSRI